MGPSSLSRLIEHRDGGVAQFDLPSQPLNEHNLTLASPRIQNGDGNEGSTELNGIVIMVERDVRW
jgi:hypothetical protein